MPMHGAGIDAVAMGHVGPLFHSRACCLLLKGSTLFGPCDFATHDLKAAQKCTPAQACAAAAITGGFAR